MTSPIQFLLKHIPADYAWEDENIVRIGRSKDIAAYVAGDFKGTCLIFCHGNGEMAVSEKYWFKKLVEAGVSVVCPDYRGYGLTAGRLSEAGCYEVAHAAYSYLTEQRKVCPADVYVLGYSLGSAIAVELVTTTRVGGLILQAPFLSGEALLKFWAKNYASYVPECVLESGQEILSGVFPTAMRLPKVTVPALVIHGTADEVIPYSQGEQIFKMLPSAEKRFVPVKNGGHNTFQYFMGDDYIGTLARFVGVAALSTICILGFKAKVARTFLERTRGLIGTKSLSQGEGLLIEKCKAIHTCFMLFPIDAYFLDRNDKVVKVVRNIPPWRLFVWGGFSAVKVLETAHSPKPRSASGSLSRSKS